MQPVRTEYSNITYVADGCLDLPATICQRPEGKEVIETVWELSDEELEQVMKDRRIYLYIMGRQVPPVLLSAESYREDFEGN